MGKQEQVPALAIFVQGSLWVWSAAVPSRESPLQPRPVGTVPEFAAHTHSLDEGSLPADGNVSRAGDGCGGVCVCTKRRWHDHRPAWKAGKGDGPRTFREGVPNSLQGTLREVEFSLRCGPT